MPVLDSLGWGTDVGKTAQDDGDIFGVVGFLSHFSDLTDGRHAGKVVYPLDEVLLLAVLAVLAGAGTLTDIATASAGSSQPWMPVAWVDW
jgi:hypothetical protein